MIDQGAVAMLQQNLPSLMVSSPKIYADQFLEMIALMSKRWVQIEWPNLLPVIFLTYFVIGADLLPLFGRAKRDQLCF